MSLSPSYPSVEAEIFPWEAFLTVTCLLCMRLLSIFIGGDPSLSSVSFLVPFCNTSLLSMICSHLFVCSNAVLYLLPVSLELGFSFNQSDSVEERSRFRCSKSLVVFCVLLLEHHITSTEYNQEKDPTDLHPNKSKTWFPLSTSHRQILDLGQRERNSLEKIQRRKRRKPTTTLYYPCLLDSGMK